jgi:hypothetical protein
VATVSGQGTTFNLPNYTGELFSVSPSDTPFLSAIGGLSGGKTAKSVEFEWQTEGLESTSVNNSKVEGAAAPTASGVDRQNVSNVVEIHQESIEVSYTKQAATALKSGTNATARTTRGLLTAITTNVFANAGTPRALTKAIMDSALSNMFSNGATLAQDNTVFLVGPGQKIALSNLYSTAVLNQPTMTRNVGGVAIDTIITDFGTFGVMVDRWMPTGKIAVADLSVCAPVFLDIPGKGHLFAEPLAKTGASEKFQLYGEIGLEYGPEVYHGLIADLS